MFLYVTNRNFLFFVAKFKHGFWFRTFFIRLDNQVHLAKLSGTTRLFFMPVVGLCRLGNCFAVRHLRHNVVNIDFVHIVEEPFQHVHVVFAHTVNQQLLQFFGVFNNISWVFKLDFTQYFTHFFIIRFVFGFHCHRMFRSREFNRFIFYSRIFVRQRLVEFCFFQFYGATNVSCNQFVNFCTVFSGRCKHLRKALFVGRF